MPFAECAKGVFNRFCREPRQYDPISFDVVGDFIARPQMQGRTNRLWDRRLRLAGQFAGNHMSTKVRIFLTNRLGISLVQVKLPPAEA